MEQNQNLVKKSESKKNLGVFENKEDVEISLGMAMLNTGLEEHKIKALMPLVFDAIADCFPEIKIEWILEGIKKGSYGEYGKTYKFTAQEVCIWIRENLKTKVYTNGRGAKVDYKGNRILSSHEL